MSDIESVPHYYGHRERLKKRFLSSNSGALPDYEILELLLCLAKPRSDQKPLAKSLINTYGSLAQVLTADQNSLLNVKGIGANVITTFKLVQETAIRLVKEDMTTRPILESWKNLLDYCRATMGHIKIKQFRVLFLDVKNMIVADELQEHGTVNHIQIYPREILKRALSLGASSLILVHNHPSGNIKPSKEDIEVTKQLLQSALLMDITIHDHVIISNKNHYSFKANGLL
ncbi:hypothetical protein NOVO_02750 [Rickettsiales bacterium Ac37b]|nr:hypothetical protein NOVO_02750 [Rickettsiales bacterium Ac37b]